MKTQLFLASDHGWSGEKFLVHIVKRNRETRFVIYKKKISI